MVVVVVLVALERTGGGIRMRANLKSICEAVEEEEEKGKKLQSSVIDEHSNNHPRGNCTELFTRPRR